MKPPKTSIRSIGNSRGVVIPEPMLVQAGSADNAGVVVLHRWASRAGWAEAAQRVAEAGENVLVMGEFGNADDAVLARQARMSSRVSSG